MLPADNQASWTYSLAVVQQPKRARAMGFGERDRRPVDPCPIVQLRIYKPDRTEDHEAVWKQAFVVHATLFDETGTIEYALALTRSIPNSDTLPPPVQDIDESQQAIVGSLVSSMHHVRDLSGDRGFFFCFPDIRVRVPGKFCLRFTLVPIPHTDVEELVEYTNVLAEVFTEPFTVHTIRDFPGVDESTPLTKKFNLQGVGIPVRNKGRLKTSTSGRNTDDGDTYDDEDE